MKKIIFYLMLSIVIQIKPIDLMTGLQSLHKLLNELKEHIVPKKPITEIASVTIKKTKTTTTELKKIINEIKVFLDSIIKSEIKASYEDLEKYIYLMEHYEQAYNNLSNEEKQRAHEILKKDINTIHQRLQDLSTKNLLPSKLKAEDIMYVSNLAETIKEIFIFPSIKLFSSKLELEQPINNNDIESLHEKYKRLITETPLTEVQRDLLQKILKNSSIEMERLKKELITKNLWKI